MPPSATCTARSGGSHPCTGRARDGRAPLNRSHHEENRIRRLVGRSEDWQGHDLHPKRRAQEPALRLQYALRRYPGHQPRGTAGRRARRLLHHGAVQHPVGIRPGRHQPGHQG
ncbi:hypothetical protein G6F59_015268 [Rhizopus arrhizus]|nr:hypothetical protein G6F59_015268 [Rhizopus arrhizus]